MDPDIEQLATQLARLRTPREIQAFRRRLDKPTAQKVIKALSPLDRAAILLCLTFKADDYRSGPDARIIPMESSDLESMLAD